MKRYEVTGYNYVVQEKVTSKIGGSKEVTTDNLYIFNSLEEANEYAETKHAGQVASFKLKKESFTESINDFAGRIKKHCILEDPGFIFELIVKEVEILSPYE